MLGLKAKMYKIVGLAILDLYFQLCVELVFINVDLMSQHVALIFWRDTDDFKHRR